MRQPRKTATALIFGSLTLLFLWGAMRGETVLPSRAAQPHIISGCWAWVAATCPLCWWAGETIRDQHLLDLPPITARAIGLTLYALGFALLFTCLLLGRPGS